MVGMKNGKLLAAAEASGYQVLLTSDREIPYQQNLRNRSISIVIMRSQTNDLRDLVPLVPSLLAALETIQPGQILTIPND